jgi:hypothetical protein
MDSLTAARALAEAGNPVRLSHRTGTLALVLRGAPVRFPLDAAAITDSFATGFRGGLRTPTRSPLRYVSSLVISKSVPQRLKPSSVDHLRLKPCPSLKFAMTCGSGTDKQAADNAFSLPLGWTRLAFPRRIPGLKSETWAPFAFSGLNRFGRPGAGNWLASFSAACEAVPFVRESLKPGECFRCCPNWPTEKFNLDKSEVHEVLRLAFRGTKSGDRTKYGDRHLFTVKGV